jgi:hypothetical protein
MRSTRPAPIPRFIMTDAHRSALPYGESGDGAARVLNFKAKPKETSPSESLVEKHDA